MTATEATATPTEDERMMTLVKACQHCMLEGDDADSVDHGATSWDNGRQITKVTSGEPDPEITHKVEVPR